MDTIILRTRADLFRLPAFAGLLKDSEGQPCVWENSYSCEYDGNAWSDSWSCQCDDECGRCGKGMSPVGSDWIGPDDRMSRGLWETLPDKGIGLAEIPVIVEGDRVTLAEGWIVIGRDAPTVLRAGPWPAADAWMRARVPGLAEGAIVYEIDTGEPGDGWSRFEAGVVENNEVVPGTLVSLRVEKAAFAAFYEAWERDNPIPDTTPDQGDTPSI